MATVKRQLLIVNSLCLLFFCLPFPATAQAEDVPRSINESTMVGIGGYNLRDTYLSPSTDINYTGWVAWVLNERMKIVRLADYNVSRQQLINVSSVRPCTARRRQTNIRICGLQPGLSLPFSASAVRIKGLDRGIRTSFRWFYL